MAGGEGGGYESLYGAAGGEGFERGIGDKCPDTKNRLFDRLTQRRAALVLAFATLAEVFIIIGQVVPYYAMQLCAPSLPVGALNLKPNPKP